MFKIYSKNIQKYSKNILKIFKKYLKNIQKIFKIYSKYIQNLRVQLEVAVDVDGDGDGSIVGNGLGDGHLVLGYVTPAADLGHSLRCTKSTRRLQCKMDGILRVRVIRLFRMRTEVPPAEAYGMAAEVARPPAPWM